MYFIYYTFIKKQISLSLHHTIYRVVIMLIGTYLDGYNIDKMPLVGYDISTKA